MQNWEWNLLKMDLGMVRVHVQMAAVVDDSQVFKAFLALQQYEQKKSKPPNLTAEDGLIWAMVALTRIPQGTKRPVRIPLPHSLHGEQCESEVCLITKDTKRTVKDLLSRKEVTFIRKVIPLDKLGTEFKSFESRRQLCSSFDVFLADSSIYHRLHGLLGKSFYARKKFPLPVSMKKKDLKLELEVVLSSTHFYLGLGSCVSIPVSRLNFTPKQGNENVQALAKGLALHLPGGWPTVQSFHLKTVDSVALPIHKMLPTPPATVMVEGYSRRIERKRGHEDEPANTRAEETDSPPSTLSRQKRTKPAAASKRKRQIGTASLARIRGSRVRKAVSVRTSS